MLKWILATKDPTSSICDECVKLKSCINVTILNQQITWMASTPPSPPITSFLWWFMANFFHRRTYTNCSLNRAFSWFTPKNEEVSRDSDACLVNSSPCIAWRTSSPSVTSEQNREFAQLPWDCTLSPRSFTGVLHSRSHPPLGWKWGPGHPIGQMRTRRFRIKWISESFCINEETMGFPTLSLGVPPAIYTTQCCSPVCPGVFLPTVSSDKHTLGVLGSLFL